MSEDKIECAMCLFVESREGNTVTCLVFDADGVHNGEKYYAVKIVLGGDRQKINELIDVVRSYMTDVLGVPEQFNSGMPPVRKPH